MATNSPLMSPLAEASSVASKSSLFAAVDLGSNSFHLLISRYEHGEFNVVDRQREVVRLAGGLDEEDNLNEETATRALECLNRFGQLLRSIPATQVRAVGTNALRRMNDKTKFLDAAERALGHNIEIIAGREEARLIYLGVSKWSTGGGDARLVIDIGGGSTEIIAGKDDSSDCRESLEVGCVVLSNQFFKDGCLSEARFEQAILAAELAIQPVVKQFRLQGWSQALGCSGTMKSINNVMTMGGWTKDGISREALHKLLKQVIEAGHIDHLDFDGLSVERKPVFPGGLAILVALFELFDIQELSVSDIALREGVLYDLVGRSSAEDIRDTTVLAMLNKWGVKSAHGEKVKQTALALYSQIANDWDISDQWYKNMLSWSAMLHELGLLISHDGYQKHGAYIVQNADMSGFARRDQLLLAALISGHRRKFPVDRFEVLPASIVTPAKRLAVILRLAVLLHRERGSRLEAEPRVKIKGQAVELSFADDWLSANPLTAADLAQEKAWLKLIGVKLNYC